MIAYFDTSAYLKTLLADEASPVVRALWDDAEQVVVSLLLYPEVLSGVARARRDRRPLTVSEGDLPRVLHADMDGAQVVAPTFRVVREAGEIAKARSLRGFDAVHLASAKQAGPDVVLVTADKRLAAAADEEGVVVLFLVAA